MATAIRRKVRVEARCDQPGESPSRFRNREAASVDGDEAGFRHRPKLGQFIIEFQARSDDVEVDAEIAEQPFDDPAAKLVILSQFDAFDDREPTVSD
jgi:hypothetical protein